MLLRLMRFNVTAFYTPGKHMVIADSLSRSPRDVADASSQLETDVDLHVNGIRATWPASDTLLDRIREETANDDCLSTALHYTAQGWPKYPQDVRPAASNLFSIRGELSNWNGILLYGHRLAIPKSMQQEVMKKIHQGHQGIVKCRERARDSVWWPGISVDIERCVSSCAECQEKLPSQTREPLLPSTPPARPFQRIGVDLCEVKGSQYLITIDYYSRYIDIAHLPQTTARTVIAKMKNCFAHHGIPETVVSDNGPQFSSAEFKQFAAEWNFKSVTSSPHFPQSNGQAESAVKTAKAIINQPDPFLALLVYRSTPIPSLGASPAELALGRKLRTTLPILPTQLQPRTLNPKVVRQRDSAAKAKQKQHYDKHHGVRPLSELQPGEAVCLKLDRDRGWNQRAEVIQQVAPRSYLLLTDSGQQLRRNRKHIRPSPPSSPALAQQSQALQPAGSSPGPRVTLPVPRLAPPGQRGPPSTPPGPRDLPPPTPPGLRCTPPPTPPGPQRMLPPVSSGQRVPPAATTSPGPRPDITRSGRVIVPPARYRE